MLRVCLKMVELDGIGRFTRRIASILMGKEFEKIPDFQTNLYPICTYSILHVLYVYCMCTVDRSINVYDMYT